jgi:hypothetical protein
MKSKEKCPYDGSKTGISELDEAKGKRVLECLECGRKIEQEKGRFGWRTVRILKK